MASAGSTQDAQSVILLGKNLCIQLIEQLWVVRLLVPIGALGVASNLKAGLSSAQKCNESDAAPRKKKTLERFYSARDWLDDKEETTESADPPAATPRSAVPADREDSQAKASSRPRNSTTSEQELRRVFDTVDEDRNGRICLAELTRFMRKLNASDCTEQQIDALLRSADEDQNGFVEFNEFIKLYASLHDSTCDAVDDLSRDLAAKDEEEAGLRDAFGVFDKNKDGFISPDELQLVVQALSKGGNHKRDCSRMIKAVDRDGDGKVNFEEFKHLMRTDLQLVQ